jgi:putative oxidoreductase
MMITHSILALAMRLIIGMQFIQHGYQKIVAGPQTWLWLGDQMKYLGIRWWPMFWGIACTATEFLGGIALVLGLGTQIACLLLFINMVVALRYHFAIHDTYNNMKPAIGLLAGVVVIAAFTREQGAGVFSLDWLISSYFSN